MKKTLRIGMVIAVIVMILSTVLSACSNPVNGIDKNIGSVETNESPDDLEYSRRVHVG